MSSRSSQIPLLETPPFVHAPPRAPRARTSRSTPVTSLTLPFSEKARANSERADAQPKGWLKKTSAQAPEGPPIERQFVSGRARTESERRRLEAAIERALGEGRRRGRSLVIRDEQEALTLTFDHSLVVASFSSRTALDRWLPPLLETTREFGLVEPE